MSTRLNPVNVLESPFATNIQALNGGVCGGVGHVTPIGRGLLCAETAKPPQASIATMFQN